MSCTTSTHKQTLSEKHMLNEFSDTYTGCFKKSFTTFEAYNNLFRELIPHFELSAKHTKIFLG
jgi:hypothetical protein